MDGTTTPLPNQESDLSDCGLDEEELVYYVIRITSHGKFTPDQLYKYLTDEYQICKYVVGRETVPQEHYHIVAGVDKSRSELDVRDIVRSFIIPFWQEMGKLPRGFGNKQYNLQLSTDVDKAVTYAVKLSEIKYEGFDDDYIEKCKSESFDKKKPVNFKVEYQELCTEFQRSNMDLREFMIKFCNLKAKYGQQVIMSHAYGYALSNSILRDNNAEDFVENFLYKQ